MNESILEQQLKNIQLKKLVDKKVNPYSLDLKRSLKK